MAYALMATGGFVGTRRKLFAFPWRAKNIERVYQRSDITLDLERLIDSSGLDGPPLPRMADLGWASDVYAYFGCKPHWE